MLEITMKVMSKIRKCQVPGKRRFQVEKLVMAIFIVIVDINNVILIIVLIT